MYQFSMAVRLSAHHSLSPQTTINYAMLSTCCSFLFWLIYRARNAVISIVIL